MVNKVKYQIEVELQSEGLNDAQIKAIGVSLGEGAEISITDDTNVSSVEVSSIKASYHQELDCIEKEDNTTI